MERPTKRFAAVLVAGVAGLAPALTGCGQNEPTKSPTQGATSAPASSEPTATTAVLPASVDFNNPKELAAALASLGIETPPVESAGLERAVVDGAAFPTWPSGDIRKAGLRTFRVDVSPSFDGKAFLKFFHGKKELYSAPFEPAKTTTVDTIPAVVVESLKTGDRITWGVYFEKKSVKPITLDFTVVDKAAATRKIVDVEANKGVSPLGRMISKAQVLKNYSFLSEALATYVEVTTADDSVTSVYTDMVDCLRRLKLKNTPLFADAQMRMTNVPSPSRKGFATGGGGLNPGVASGGPNAGDLPSGNKGKMDKIGPMAQPKTAGKPSGLAQGGGGLPPIPTPPVEPTDPTTPTDPVEADAMAAAKALAHAATDARHRADRAAKLAEGAKAEADAAKTDADAAQAKVADLQAQAAAVRAQATDPATPDADRPSLVERAEALERASIEAANLAAIAAKNAEAAADRAKKAEFDARRLDEQADKFEDQVNAALGVPVSPNTPKKPGMLPPLDPSKPLGPQNEMRVDVLTKLVQTSQQNVATAEQRLRDAQAAFETALPGSGDPAMTAEDDAARAAARAEVDAAQAELFAAGEALDRAQAALNAASK